MMLMLLKKTVFDKFVKKGKVIQTIDNTDLVKKLTMSLPILKRKFLIGISILLMNLVN